MPEEKQPNTFHCPNAVKGGNCRHEYQDSKYGKGVRIFTKLGGGGAAAGATKRCTVCLRQEK